MATETPKLRPLIHRNYDYLLEKFHLQPEHGFGADAQILRDMVDDVVRVAHANYPDALSQDFNHTVNNVRYILDSFVEVGEGKSTMPSEYISAFADALEVRFEKLLTLLENIDAQH